MFKGFAFRTKRKKLLAKLNGPGKKDADDPTDFALEDEEFDAEAFLDVKPENL